LINGEIRAYKREVTNIMRRYRTRLRAASSDEEREAIIAERDGEMVQPQILYEITEAERLTRKARKLGIQFEHDPSWWREIEPADQRWGNAGHARLRKLIRDEKFNIAGQWVKILVPVLTVLVSLLGLLVALVTVLRK
jgi:hypothetical protein